jgi:regulator of protease activity HflC (stomatin/prohibitin superfamily)
MAVHATAIELFNNSLRQGVYLRMDSSTLVLYILILVLLLMLVRAAIKIVPEYERGVVFRLGRVQAAKGPGLLSFP